MADEENIVEFPNELTPLVRDKTPKYWQTPTPCQHHYYDIDFESKTVSCRHCSKDLDPIWVLGQFCKRYDERDSKWRYIKEEQEKENERIKKRQEREAKRRA